MVTSSYRDLMLGVNSGSTQQLDFAMTRSEFELLQSLVSNKTFLEVKQVRNSCTYSAGAEGIRVCYGGFPWVLLWVFFSAPVRIFLGDLCVCLRNNRLNALTRTSLLMLLKSLCSLMSVTVLWLHLCRFFFLKENNTVSVQMNNY